ncbi:MAG: prenyltransferase [archaeon]|nr:prenyltransferase [archaeon]
MGSKLTEEPVKAGWRNVFRPWSLHGAIVPALIGGMLAFDIDSSASKILLFVLALVACGLFQSIANIFNTYGDFIKGADTIENETRSPELVSGIMTTRQVLSAGISCIVVLFIIGLIFLWYWQDNLFTLCVITTYGIIGIFSATMYTVGVSYKYHGLGQIMVFIMFGFLMPSGVYFFITGQMFTWQHLLICLPNALIITGVLAGNEMRDYYEDKKSKIRTLSGCMSYGRGMMLYLCESLVPFIVLFGLIICGVLPLLCSIGFIALYDAYSLYMNSKEAPFDNRASFMLVPICFRLNWHFGILLVLGYTVSKFIGC